MANDTSLHVLRQRPAASARGIVRACLRDRISPPGSLYIHIPFCFHKCHYCDFYSFVDTRDRQEAFVQRLCDELDALAPLCRDEPLRTIFVGGGTPTLLKPALWRILLDHLHNAFDLSAIREGRGEFTVECNPETASRDLFDVLVAGGVDRLSIGAQSFNPAHLRTLERWHDPDSVPAAIDLARASGIQRASLDLIYAIPGQSPADLADDLSRALSMQTGHLSCYNLTYEPGTAMTRRLGRGDFEPADEDTEVEMFTLVRTATADAGLDWYEVSNFAGQGQESLHNLAYWRQHDWIAAGPSASAHIGGHRYKVVPRLDDYLSHSDDGFAPIVDHEPPDERRALAERIMTGLRVREGLDEAQMASRALRIDGGTRDRLCAMVESLAGEGILTAENGRWQLTERGLLLADHAASELMSALG